MVSDAACDRVKAIKKVVRRIWAKSPLLRFFFKSLLLVCLIIWPNFEMCAALQWIQVWFTSITILDLLKIEFGQFVSASPIASDLSSYLFWKTLPILVGSKVEQTEHVLYEPQHVTLILTSHRLWLEYIFWPELGCTTALFFSLTTKCFWKTAMGKHSTINWCK